MGDPELRNDETVLVRTQAVYVKSIPFEGILTNKRIILVDRAKNLLPPKEIPLITIKEIESGENAIRDQILTLSVMAKTGETRQMILTFSRQAGGNRIKERDEWARIIRENTSTSFEQVIRKVIPGAEPPRRSESPAQPRWTVASAPVPTAPREPEGVHPVRKIVEITPPVAAPQAPPAPPAPRAETQAAVNTFCSSCGTKVPLNSAFCNRCGSPLAVAPPAAAPAPVPHFTQPAPPPEQQYTPPPAPAQVSASDALQQAAMAFTRSTARPIDRDIQEVEPLIERSSVRAPPDPLRTVPSEISIPKSFTYDEEEPEPVPAAPAPVAPAPAGKQAAKGFITKLLPQKEKQPAQPTTSMYAAPSSPPPKPPKGPGLLAGKNKTIIYAVIALVIIAVLGMVVYPMLGKGGTDQPVSTPTPPVTTIPIHIGTVVIPVTTAPIIPATGVFVHVGYLGGFKGSYGMPEAMTIVPGNSGDRVWEVEIANGTVNATFEKLDGSTHELLVEIFKDGAVLTKGSTTIGHGSVALSVNVTTGVAAAPVTSGGGTVTPAAQNQTAPAATTAASAVTATPAANSTTVVATTTSVTTAATTAAVNATATTN